MKEWARMPSYWLRDEDLLPLAKLRWNGAHKSDQIAALMIYMVVVHHVNLEATGEFDDIGWCSLTYTRLNEITGLSRAKISGGLSILSALEIIEVDSSGHNNKYRVVNIGAKGGWAKLPARGLYSKDRRYIPAFHRFKLRSKSELNALKLYLLIAALRNNANNYAVVSYDRINEYTGIARNDIKSALSLLVVLGLIQVDRGASDINEFSTVNMYRLCYLEPHKHHGTNTRSTVNPLS